MLMLVQWPVLSLLHYAVFCWCLCGHTGPVQCTGLSLAIDQFIDWVVDWLNGWWIDGLSGWLGDWLVSYLLKSAAQ